MAVEIICKVHPMVLFNIVDAYERRNEDAKRVIGTLLGSYEKTSVEVTGCFTVPHNEYDDEVAVDKDYAKSSYELHRAVSPSDVILGWYSTGPDITEQSLLIHKEYYGRVCKHSAIHLTVDTTLKGAKLGMKAYIGANMGVASLTVGTMFSPIPVEILPYNCEKVGMDVIGRTRFDPKRTVTLSKHIEDVIMACISLQEKLTVVIQYVDNVLNEKIPVDNSMGRFLMDLVSSVPKLESQKFEEMLNANMKDLLMVVYLSNLTKTQLVLSEKLNII